MSIKVSYKNGVFEPLEKVESATAYEARRLSSARWRRAVIGRRTPSHPSCDRVRSEPEADHVLYVPPAPEELLPILEIVPLQLLAYHIAVRRGCDVDQPRNLAKSVTVE